MNKDVLELLIIHIDILKKDIEVKQSNIGSMKSQLQLSEKTIESLIRTIKHENEKVRELKKKQESFLQALEGR